MCVVCGMYIHRPAIEEVGAGGEEEEEEAETTNAIGTEDPAPRDRSVAEPHHMNTLMYNYT